MPKLHQIQIILSVNKVFLEQNIVIFICLPVVLQRLSHSHSRHELKLQTVYLFMCPQVSLLKTGGEFGGQCIHVYLWLSPFTVHLKLSQHC